TPQRFTRLRIVTFLPKQHNPYRMREVRNPHLLTEVPVASVAYPYRFFGLPRNLASHRLKRLFPTVVHHLAVELQVPHIRPLGALNVVEHFGTREIAVKGEVARDVARDGIIDQLDAQLRMIFECRCGTRITLLKPTPLDRIVRSRRTDVVG